MFLGELAVGGWAPTLAEGHVSQPPPPIYSQETITSETQSASQFTQDNSSQFILNKILYYY